MDATIHERIGLLVKKYGEGKNTVFASKLGVSEGNIRGYLKGIMPKADILEKIVKTYDINARWLLLGEGEMEKSDIAETLPISDISQNCNKATPASKPGEGIPLIPIEAMAGALSGELPVLEYECDRYVVPMFKGADFLIPVKGSSMYPKYSSGDIVACQRVPMKDLFFQWNKVYVIDTNQGALIKRIRPGSDKDHVLIVSDNEKYSPFELPLTAIYAVALVIGVIRLE